MGVDRPFHINAGLVTRSCGTVEGVKRAPLQPGDVVEVELENGNWAYLQLVGLTHVTKESGIPKASMVRVLSGVYATSLSDEKIGSLVERDAAFLIQVGLGGMIEYGGVRGHWSLPDRESAIPDIRMWAAPSAENPHGWVVVDSEHGLLTEREYADRHPEIDQVMLPFNAIPAPARLRWLIEVGWTPREARSRRDDWWKDKGTYPSTLPGVVGHFYST